MRACKQTFSIQEIHSRQEGDTPVITTILRKKKNGVALNGT